MKQSTSVLGLAGLIAAMTPSVLAVAAPAAAPVETMVEAPGPAGPLKGTMLKPAAAGTPIMLIIPGSGPTDRDGNNSLGIKAATYLLLAEGLAARGIGTVRIDKRGMFGSAAAVPDANAVTIDDYASDVHAWVSAIRKQTGAPCIWVAGHSEGGLVALVAGQKPEGVCGLVLISTPGRPIGAVLREQLKANPANAPILDEALAAIDALQAGKHADVAKMNPVLLPLFRPQVQGFLINEFSYDPAKLIASIAKPVLILQGRRDIQVGVADAERLKQAAPRASLTLLADVNHVLKAVSSDDRRANAMTYTDPNLPLAPGIVDAIADFVAGAGKAQ